MGIAAIVCMFATVIFFGLWLEQMTKTQKAIEAYDRDTRALAAIIEDRDARIATLETEILRLRKAPKESKPEENRTIQAKSPAQVRQITEAAFGTWPPEETGHDAA